jgi:biotin carboxyl carrier protein
MRYDIELGGRIYLLELLRKEEGWECKLDGREISAQSVQISSDTLSVLINGKSFEIKHERTETGITIFIRGTRYEVSVTDPRSWRGRRGAAQGDVGPQKLTASMPGKVVRVLAREGDSIAAGQGIAVVEAMKMQNEIRSPRAGVLKKLLAHEGMKVNAGEVLGVVE